MEYLRYLGMNVPRGIRFLNRAQGSHSFSVQEDTEFLGHAVSAVVPMMCHLSPSDVPGTKNWC